MATHSVIKRQVGSEDSIVGRLRSLLASMEMTEIARRTGYSVSTVYHYLNGRKITAAFCAACVRHLGLNAAWVLGGRGSPAIEHDGQRSEESAESLLAAVEGAMSLARERLRELDSPLRPERLGRLRELRAGELNLQKTTEPKIVPVVTAMLRHAENLLLANDYAPILRERCLGDGGRCVGRVRLGGRAGV